MTNDSFPAIVDWLYAGLIPYCGTHSGSSVEPGLGGSLLYAGELNEAGTPLVVAGNIAGAATLAATADIILQKQAVHDGVIDFLVTTLDEAVRIFKNEVRKRETVAVCVTQPPGGIESEMVQLGVLPDLLPPGALNAPAYQVFLDQGSRQVNPVSATGSQTVVTWRVGSESARWLPKLDAIARTCLASSPNEETWSAQRWLRLSPRYLGRMANGVRLLRCDSCVAEACLSLAREQVAEGTITVPLEIHLSSGSQSELYLLSPDGVQVGEKDINLPDRRPLQSDPIVH